MEMRLSPGGAALLALVALAAFGCSKKAPPTGEPVEAIEVSAHQRVDALLGLSSAEMEGRTGTALSSTGKLFVLPADRRPIEQRPPPWRARLDVLYVRALPPSLEGGPGVADVAVRIGLWRSSGDKLRAEGRGQSELPAGDAASRQNRFRLAFDAALAEATGQLAAELDAATKPDAELIQDLESSEPIIRDFAMRVLADRKSTDAIPGLIARLREDDRELQLRAVGALVAIGDPAAALALIDTSTQRDPAFVIQVVYALGEIGGDDAEAYLFTASTGHPDAAVRSAATQALRALQTQRIAPIGDGAAAEQGAAP